jgi:hypothetical protein
MLRRVLAFAQEDEGTGQMATPAFDLSKLNWVRQQDLSDPARPVDTWTAVVGGDVEAGRVDFFSKWAPHTYCPLHRHLGETISVVLEGEHYVEELDGSKKIRPPGHYACTADGAVHWEHGGPDGSVVFFSLQSDRGLAFELVDRNGAAVGVISVAEMLAGEVIPLAGQEA